MTSHQRLIPVVQTFSAAHIVNTSRFGNIRALAEEKIERIGEMLEQGFVLQCATSFGKDSSCVLVLMLEAIKRKVLAGETLQTSYVTTSNTQIENPAMDTYTEAMQAELERYCQLYSLPVEVIRVKPSITSSFAYGTIGRGRLPVFVGAQRSCSVDWKLRPQQKAVKELMSTLQNPGDLITLVGTRSSESASRGSRMRVRGEDKGEIVQAPNGTLTCSIIAEWEMTDVWELLMACDSHRGGIYSTFTTDFEWCLELYKEANEGMCAIITGDGGNKAACGSRFGCSLCLVTGDKDKSMEAMISSAPEKHGHLNEINRLRTYLLRTRFDMGKRDWLGRTYCKKTHSINVTATAYSAEMRRDILRYMLTLDAIEEERAEEHDAKMHRGELEDTPYNRTLRGITFQFITPQQLVAIDFAWSLSFGFEHAFPALREWYSIRVQGKRYAIPEVETAPKGAMPEMAWYQFDSWDSPANEKGLEDAYLIGLNKQRHAHRPSYRSIKDRFVGQQREIIYFEESDEMNVDAGQAMLFVDGFDDEFLQLAVSLEPTASAKFYLDRALVTLAKGKASAYDEMARRAQYWNRLKASLPGTDLRAFVHHHSISDLKHNEQLDQLARVANETACRERQDLLSQH